MHSYTDHRFLHSFPTRRSSDLAILKERESHPFETSARLVELLYNTIPAATRRTGGQDRKSTRLNSSHVAISYAVFCFTKKIKLAIEATSTKSTKEKKSTRKKPI